MTNTFPRSPWWTACVVLPLVVPLPGGQQPGTGPETEKRFPPLKLPPNFQATLFACDPLIAYPSAIALGPRPGTLFVAVDYLTGLGTEIVRRDEIRLIEDTDGDGYADKATVYADQFDSIQGLTSHAGTLYAMHAPLLTALADTDGDGKADQRCDLLKGLGLPPEENPVRLHCANGVAYGHDGWLYLALGDHGCDVPRPEGDRLVLHGGGILRCRPNGRDLHVFATGLRNIYDVALDGELNVFVRDNENDGGDYKIRVCHSFVGADHGYPYRYYERPDEAMPPLADLGLGSSAGGVGYREPHFPAEYRGNLFFCEWGRSVVRYQPQRAAAGFAPLEEGQFAAGADNDPYGFKPTDLVVDRDGSLIVADWADGQQPKRGRGRIYRVRYVGEEASHAPAVLDDGDRTLGQWIGRLDADSYDQRVEAQETIERRGREGLEALTQALAEGRVGPRGRLHAVWILAHVGGPASVHALFDLAEHDIDPRLQAQAVRALADLTDPVLVRHHLDAGPGDAELSARVAALAQGKDSRVVLEVILAVGRHRWPGTPDWLCQLLSPPLEKGEAWDAALAHAAMQALRRSQNWPALLKLLDEPSVTRMRTLALRAIADQAVPALVDGLIERLTTEADAARRLELADLLTRVHRKPGPWAYWGYRPPPRPPNTVLWQRTTAIEQALDRALADPDRAVRLAVLRRMQRERIPTNPATLGRWLRKDREPEPVAAILASLGEHPASEVRNHLNMVVRQAAYGVPERLTALALLAEGLDESSEPQLLALGGALEDGPLLAEALRLIGRRPRRELSPLLLSKLKSPHPAVRAAAIEVLAERHTPGEEARPTDTALQELLDDPDVAVRRAAAAAAGKMAADAAIPSLLNLAGDADPSIRQASLASLRLLHEPRVVPLAVAALADRTTQVAALECLEELGGPDQLSAVVETAARTPSAEVLPLVLRLLSAWRSREPAKRAELDDVAAELQATSGMLARWHAAGPLSAGELARLIEQHATLPSQPQQPDPAAPWTLVFGTGSETRVHLPPARELADAVWLAYTDVRLPEPTAVQFLASSGGPVRIRLNGQLLYQRAAAGTFQPDSDRFDAVLPKGLSRVFIEVATPPNPHSAASAGQQGGKTRPSPEGHGVEFHLRFRRKSPTAEHERLIQAALTSAGNAERGRKLFFDAEKSQCVKCHRLGDQGERIGPELTGIGERFSRIHIIESILEPSRTIAPGFQTVAVSLKDGRVLSGIKVADTDQTLVLADNQGRKHTLAKSEIEQETPQPSSTMPEDLAKSLTADEFADLITFLASQTTR